MKSGQPELWAEREDDGLLEFSGFVLDPRRRMLLSRDGQPLDITARAFDTLYYFAAHPHELLDKQRLMKAVWPTSVVEENNLNQQVSALRRLLGDTGRRHFIVTVTGRGYRFVQDVRRIERSPVAQLRGLMEQVRPVVPANAPDATSQSPAFAGPASQSSAPRFTKCEANPTRRRRSWTEVRTARAIPRCARRLWR